jgi:ribosomal protein L7Ae-like RNA K-turn-binding protein
MNHKLAGALGLCCRAGKLIVGIGLVREALRSGKAALVVLAADTASNGENKIIPLAEHRHVPVHRSDLSKMELGAALGKEGAVAAVAVPKEFLNLVLASL